MNKPYKRPKNINTIQFQKKHWEKELRNYNWENDEIFGNAWGNPEDPKDRWGNYLSLKKRIQSMVKPNMTVLDLGSLSGKWTQYVLDANEIICVDITDAGFDYIKEKFPKDNIKFYLTKGDELDGIEDNSVDFLLCVDTLVRAPKKCIEKYFIEISRVMKPGGKILVHLANDNNNVCVRKEFTLFTEDEIVKLCSNNQFKNIFLDVKTLIHGVIVEAQRKNLVCMIAVFFV